MSDTVNKENLHPCEDATDETFQSTFDAVDLDSLSEFERARVTSKTWSMGQD